MPDGNKKNENDNEKESGNEKKKENRDDIGKGKGEGNEYDFVFETNDGAASIMDNMKTFAPQLKVDANVIDSYSLVLNHEEKGTTVIIDNSKSQLSYDAKYKTYCDLL
ncbi:hypothetical protein Tco_1251409, partial [Tanacetum coccineum]